MSEKQNRHLELSSKFMEMGQALVREGLETKDHSIIQSGNVFVMLGGMIVNDDDMLEFIHYLSKFSSKKLLDGLETSGSDVYKYIHAIGDFSIDEFINEIKKIRKNKPDEEPDNTNKDEE